MKKIVMAVAAIAMAATMFAADVSAAVQGFGNLFSIEAKKDAKPVVLGWNDPWDREFAWYSTGIGFSVTADKAGLSFELDNRDVTVKHSNFWIQPVDMLKIKLGDNTIEFAKESIDYAGTVFTSSFEGFVFELAPIDGLTITTGLVTGCKGGWNESAWISGGKIGEVTATVAYDTGDYGKVTVLYDYNNKANIVGIDYDANFGGVAVSPSVAYAINGETLAADLYVVANVAGVGINAYTKADVDFNGDTAVAVNTKFSYNTAIGAASLQLKDDNILAKNFAMMAKAALDFNCGSAGMQVALQADIDETVKISVPFMYNLHF